MQSPRKSKDQRGLSRFGGGATNDPANKIIPEIHKSSSYKMLQIADIFIYFVAHDSA
jgi:hypothetical protein